MPKTVQFKIDYPPTKAGKSYWNKKFGLNAYYSGKPWQARKRDADYWHTITLAAIRQQIERPVPFEKPVTIEAYFNDNLDASNHAAELKMIEDSLKGILIADDNRKYVKGVSMFFHNEEHILVRIKEITSGD